MYVLLDDDCFPDAAEDVQNFLINIELLLTSHQQKRHIFALDPSQVFRISGYSLGAVAGIALNAIRTRSNDYIAAAASAHRVLKLHRDDELLTPFQIEPGGVVSVRISEFARSRSQFSPKLFVEHGINDAEMVKTFFDLYCTFIKKPNKFAMFSPLHGGGSGIGDALQAIPSAELLGVCFVDRDWHGFSGPLVCKHNGTAYKARSAANAMNIISNDDIGYSSIHPYFAFHMSDTVTIESYIGPYLLEEFYKQHPGAMLSRKRFSNAFPNFPNLNVREAILWFVLNLKDGTKNEEYVAAALNIAGQSPMVDGEFDILKDVFMPENLNEWVSSKALMPSRARQTRIAFEKDMEIELYSAALKSLWQYCWDLLAADARISFV